MTGTLPGAAATVTGSGDVACAAPELRDVMGPWDRVTLPSQPMDRDLIAGGGMAIADLDGDDRPDLFIPSESTWQLWLQTEDRQWVDAADRIPPISLSFASGASSADYDGDGDFDLFVTRDRAPDVLLRNDGGWFVDVTLEAGFDDRAWRSMASAWADWDRDGDLDLSVATYSRTQPNSFWANQGDGTFVEVFLLPESWLDGLTFQLTWHDLEDDGYPDLFVMNDHPDSGAPTGVFANHGGVLTEDGSCGYNPGWNGMGVVVTDFDEDLLPDVVGTSWKSIELHLGTPWDGTDQGLLFVDATAAWGLTADRIAMGQRFSWGIDAGDLELDGDMDLIATWGNWESGDFQILEQPDSVWHQEDGHFVEEPPHDYEVGRAALLVDLDGDGYLDLVKRNLQAPTTIDRSVCGDGTWSVVRLHDVPASLNRYGIGSKVTIDAGGRSWVRWIESGSRSMYASGPPEVHVGLAGAEVIERLEVVWPDGRVATFHDLPARQRLTVTMLEAADR